MSSGTLYRKYRSKTFKDIIGQEHITTTLENSIKNGSFAHAYLLTGPRGVGKTSVARLFAYKINGIEYKGDETYSDIIEIDAASNRRIDEIRELREKINIAPSALKYKVYIIDEVHMLTREAFNALLKTLEEPPEHAIFILATTDFHKVPDTIVSRCVRFSFLAITRDSIEKHLKHIASKESIDIEEQALEIIAMNAEGSFRDAISLLDQFRNSQDKISADYVRKVLGISPDDEIAELIRHISDSEPIKIIESLDRLRDAGSDEEQIIKQTIIYLRSSLLQKEESRLSKAKIVKLIEDLLSIDKYSDIRIAVEIVFIEASIKKIDQAEKNIETTQTIEAPKKLIVSKPPKQTSNLSESKLELWDSVLAVLKETNNTLYAISRMADAKVNGGELELYFKFPFHYKQMSLEKNYLQIEKSVKSVDKDIQKVRLLVYEKDDDGTKQEILQEQKKPKEPVKSISNIFGPSEVLES